MYELNEEEKIPIIKNLLSRESPKLIKTFINTDNKHANGEKPISIMRNLNIVISKQYFHYNTVNSKKSHDSAKEWMDRFLQKQQTMSNMRMSEGQQDNLSMG